MTSTDIEDSSSKIPLSTRIVGYFLQGPFPVLLIVISLIAGFVALVLTPREEEPQIIVPLADVFVNAPGLSAEQVARQVSTPLEKLLYQIDGVEYVYSMSHPGQSVVTVRFYVGEGREASLIKIYNKLYSHLDLVPKEVESWVVKPVEIDDVPIVIATLWSRDPEKYDDYALRRIAEEAEIKLQSVPKTNAISIVSGRPRTIRIEMDPEAMAGHRTTPLDLDFALSASNKRVDAGGFENLNRVIQVQSGDFIQSAEELSNLVVNVVDGIPVYLKDVAKVFDGPDEIESYSWIGFGPAAPDLPQSQRYPSVSLAVAKKKGSNAVSVAEDVLTKLDALKESFFPPEIEVQITRNYGETADEKVNELVEGLGVAVLTVVIFIGMVLGWRAALIVALAIPVCYGAALACNLLGGYTINRVTLFALILALGLLVDDPITDVENIARYFAMGKHRAKKNVLHAVQEVRPALVMSTIAIILCFIPMFFITGMMGPYMAPMALNVPLTVIISTIVAFCITPFLSLHFLKGTKDLGDESAADIEKTPLYKIYNFFIRPLVRHRAWSYLFLLLVGVLFFAAVLLPGFRLVPLKMLPFDNKNEFQIGIDMPEGTTLEETQAVTAELAESLRTVPEVEFFVGYVGEPSPMDFNGMVRHYYLREGSQLADIRIGLAHKDNRVQQSHEIVLRLRNQLEEIASKHGAVLQLVEVPPGPPVISTLVAEVYGEDETPYAVLQESAQKVAERLKREPLVVDVDTSVEADQEKALFVVDKEKAALSGVSTVDVAQTISMALQGSRGHFLEDPDEAHPLEIRLQLPRSIRSSTEELSALYVKGQPGIMKVREGGSLRDAPQPLVPIGEIGEWKTETVDQTIYHKNLKPVAYVFAEMAGRPPAEAVLDVGADFRKTGERHPIDLENRTYFAIGGGDPWTVADETKVVWNGEGEWKITLDVFRDLGIAFGAALLGIFLVLYIQTNSALLSTIIMTAIPLTMIGIMPGFWFLNSIGDRMIDGYPNPTFFTATAMIGMIALAGIVVRNSVVLIDFVHMALREGMDLEEALVRSGAIRTRPIFLTAGTTFLGNVVITLDPIFSGLAWSIIFGIAASTFFTLGVIPVVYFLVYGNKPGHGLPVQEEIE
ncbi:MAG: efflux RND transporter permease subunit [Candidatus Omnitrophica bacterium]|nr:efflux RND transporter permease subunit [Candidatus Omnitrophota bacterium]